MRKHSKPGMKILTRSADADIAFSGLCQSLNRLGFTERINGTEAITFLLTGTGKIRYWSAEDRALIVEVQEFSGGMADGDTYELAVATVRAVIA